MNAVAPLIPCIVSGGPPVAGFPGEHAETLHAPGR
ncbi:hypothetical protein PAERUG_P48_London_17_VIM_2_01_13_04313 [Pseudomonas aeruginosa]|nr:hypothetical protein PAERUG_P48_London_17_VIM_2_01_13_04313 [Pseudomonas aeruginosa]